MSAGDASPEGVYLDYGGFAPVDPRVLAVMRPFLEAGIGNPSAPHSLGAEARAALEAARVKVARRCGGAAAGVIFTSGATEANNLAIRGVALGPRGAGGARVIVSSVEHVSVVNACRDLERGGAAVVILPVDSEGRVVLDALRSAPRPPSFRSAPRVGRSGRCSRSARSAGSRVRRACPCTSTPWAPSGGCRSPSTRWGSIS